MKYPNYKLSTYHSRRLGGICKSAAIVGRPTVTRPASNVLIIVTQTTVVKTMADVVFDGFSVGLAEMVFTESSMTGESYNDLPSPSFAWMLVGRCRLESGIVSISASVSVTAMSKYSVPARLLGG